MQGGIEAAEAIDAGLRAGDVSAGAFAGYERAVRKRYHHFRRFAVGFYDPAFRDRVVHATPSGSGHLPGDRLGPRRQLATLAADAAKIEVFFAVVAGGARPPAEALGLATPEDGSRSHAGPTARATDPHRSDPETEGGTAVRVDEQPRRHHQEGPSARSFT